MHNGGKTMFVRVYTAALLGIDGFEVTVECSALKKLPTLEIIGLADTAVKEARERIRAATTNSGIRFPQLEMIVNFQILSSQFLRHRHRYCPHSSQNTETPTPEQQQTILS